MFTLRFEKTVPDGNLDSGGSDVHSLVGADSYVAHDRGDHVEMILTQDGEEVTFIIGSISKVMVAGVDHTWDRCYVMNGSGATVDRIKEPGRLMTNTPDVRAAA